jgi:hypothetical protein
MADHINNPERPERYEETTDPNLPPNVMLSKSTRNGAFWAYVGPLIALFVVFAIAMLYWMNNRNQTQPGNTSGDTNPGDRRDGGFEPAPKPDSTSGEVERRGGDGK